MRNYNITTTIYSIPKNTAKLAYNITTTIYSISKNTQLQYITTTIYSIPKNTQYNITTTIYSIPGVYLRWKSWNHVMFFIKRQSFSRLWSTCCRRSNTIWSHERISTICELYEEASAHSKESLSLLLRVWSICCSPPGCVHEM
jgi:hypothetical protein